MNNLEVIEALCNLLIQAIDLIQDEAEARALRAEFDEIMGERGMA